MQKSVQNWGTLSVDKWQVAQSSSQTTRKNKREKYWDKNQNNNKQTKHNHKKIILLQNSRRDEHHEFELPNTTRQLMRRHCGTRSGQSQQQNSVENIGEWSVNNLEDTHAGGLCTDLLLCASCNQNDVTRSEWRGILMRTVQGQHPRKIQWGTPPVRRKAHLNINWVPFSCVEFFFLWYPLDVVSYNALELKIKQFTTNRPRDEFPSTVETAHSHKGTHTKHTQLKNTNITRT